MRQMVLDHAGGPLRLRQSVVPSPGPQEILLPVRTCGVCRTDLHVHDGELDRPKLQLALRQGQLQGAAVLETG